MLLQDLLTNLCKDLKISPVPKENKEKIFIINITDKVTVFFQALETGCFMWSNLMTPPKEGREDLFMYLMKANLLNQGTGGSTIGLDINEKFLTLSIAMPYELNYQGFKEKLEDFVNYVIYWREEITKIQKAKENNLFG